MLNIKLLITTEYAVIWIFLSKFFEKKAVPNFKMLYRGILLEFIYITLFKIHIERIYKITCNIGICEPLVKHSPYATANS
jgi:hypothetical protein